MCMYVWLCVHVCLCVCVCDHDSFEIFFPHNRQVSVSEAFVNGKFWAELFAEKSAMLEKATQKLNLCLFSMLNSVKRESS